MDENTSVYIHDERKSEIPYVELEIMEQGQDGELLDITIRKYPKRVFVAYCDDNGDGYMGSDNMDVWMAPSYITEKTPHPEFNLLSALTKINKIVNSWNEDNSIAQDWYKELSPIWNNIMSGNIEKANDMICNPETYGLSISETGG